MTSLVPEPVRPEFWTCDLYLAAFLQVEGCPLLRTERESRGRVQFIFQASDETNTLRGKWFARDAITNATRFTESIRGLKDLVHSVPGGRPKQ